MKSIPELNKELEDAKLAYEAYEGRQKAREIKREISKLIHPHIHKLGNRIKSVGRTTGKSLIKMGEHAHKGIKPYAEEMAKKQRKSPHGWDSPVYKKFSHSKGKKKKHKRYSRYYERPRDRYIRPKRKRHRQSYSNPYSMFG